MFVYVRKFEIEPDVEPEFVRVYGPRGEWVQLFARSSEYITTELLHDTAVPGRYLTVDRWTSAGAFDAFRARCRDAIDELERRSDALTRTETFLGQFESERVTLFLGRDR